MTAGALPSCPIVRLAMGHNKLENTRIADARAHCDPYVRDIGSDCIDTMHHGYDQPAAFSQERYTAFSGTMRRASDTRISLVMCTRTRKKQTRAPDPVHTHGNGTRS